MNLTLSKSDDRTTYVTRKAFGSQNRNELHDGRELTRRCAIKNRRSALISFYGDRIAYAPVSYARNVTGKHRFRPDNETCSDDRI